MIDGKKKNKTHAEKYASRIWWRLHKLNKNWLAIICGETGSGKSYTALSFAETIVVPGNKLYIVFNALQFMQLINDDKLKRGDFIIFDEAGVGMSSREWYSQQNKLLGSVLQTFRNMNIGVIFTTPNLSFIDVQARKLFHAYFETASIDRENSVAYVKVFDIQVLSRLDKTLFRFPIFKDEFGCDVQMTHMGIGLPTPGLVDKYERMKAEYTKSLNESALKELDGSAKADAKENAKKKKFDKDYYVTEVLKDVDLYKGQQGKITVGKVRALLNLSEYRAKEVVNSIML